METGFCRVSSHELNVALYRGVRDWHTHRQRINLVRLLVPKVLLTTAALGFNRIAKLQCITDRMVVRPYSVRQLHNYNLKQSHPPIMLHDNRASPCRLVRHLFPNRIDVWSFEITSAVPAPTPYYQTHSSDGEQQEKRKGTNLLLGRG